MYKAALILSFACFAMTLASSSQATAKPDTRNRNEIDDKYKWDLSQIYDGWQAWEADLARLQDRLCDLAGGDLAHRDHRYVYSGADSGCQVGKAAQRSICARVHAPLRRVGRTGRYVQAVHTCRLERPGVGHGQR